MRRLDDDYGGGGSGGGGGGGDDDIAAALNACEARRTRPATALRQAY